MIEIAVSIENIYDSETILTADRVTVPAPPAEVDEREDWAQDVLFPLTGTGRTEGNSAYVLTITASDDPELVGATYEFGF